MYYDIIKKRLAEEIRASNKTNTELGKEVGVGNSMITEYCTTKKLPSLETFAALCKALDVSADYMLGLTDKIR